MVRCTEAVSPHTVVFGFTFHSTANREVLKSARKLSATAIYPLTSLSFMLLAWQKSELEDVVLSDSDCDEEDSNSNEELPVKYATEEEYTLYVPQSAPLLIDGRPILPRRMERVQTHHMMLGVDTLFKHSPKLQEYLEAEYDTELVASVRPFIPTLWTLHANTVPDLSSGYKPAGGPHH